MSKYFRGISVTPLLLLSLSHFSFLFPLQALAESGRVITPTPAQQMLKQMVDANRMLSYKGRFTYEQGGALRTLEVLHQLENGQILERLSHLNGPQRELVHYQDQLDCQKPSEMLLRGLQVDWIESNYSLLTDNYELLLKGQGRIAGRTANIIHIIPKDIYRYGYSLALDEQTGLLLQSMLIDVNKKVLERFQFVQLEVNPELEDQKPKLESKQDQKNATKTLPCKPDTQVQHSSERWQTGWLPPGFILTDYQVSPEGQTETQVYSDGLAVFSVFIDSNRDVVMPEVQAQRGATVAFLANKKQGNDEYLVCVVGEVPPETARKVALALSYPEEKTP